MPKEFDRRVIPPTILTFIRACQERVPCHLGGGPALAGAYLRHRMTGDIDLFSHQAHEMRTLVRVLSDAAASAGVRLTIVRDAGVLAWLLSRFPTDPMPQMLEPLTADELLRFRDELAERLRKIAAP